MNWLQCLLFGFISGLSEFLPISASAHEIILGRIFGAIDVGYGIRLAVHIGALLAVFFSCRPQISKISRERRISALPPRRRKRNPDLTCLKDWKILKTAAIPLFLGFLAYPWVGDQGLRLWILGIGLIAGGILLYIPQFMAGANKTAQTATPVDALLIGLGGALGVLPGVSRVGATLSFAQMRGCGKEYCLHLALLLSVPALLIYIILDVIYLFALGISGFSFVFVLGAILASLTAFAGGYLAIYIMRFLSVKAGYSAFAYYNWGAAMFAFILYLAI